MRAAHVSATNQQTPLILRSTTGLLSDLDALAEHLQGRFVVQVTLDGDRRRSLVYRSAAAAEKAARRAQERGQQAHVTLCQLLPVGVVVGLGGGR